MEQQTAIPDYNVADQIFNVKSIAASNTASGSLKSSTVQALMESIKKNKLAPLYYYLHTEALPQIIPWDEQLYQSMKEENDQEIAKLEEQIKEAESDEEEMSIVDNWVRLGEYYAKIGDKTRAISTLRKAFEMNGASAGSKIDIAFTIIRIGFFFDDKPFIAKELDAVKGLIDRGGDWERRNRFKTYNGLFLMSTRNFNEAADLLIDSLSTFTSTEIAKYEEIVEYAVLCGAISLGRVDLKQKVIDSPEVLSLAATRPSLEPITMLTNSLYTCEYASFFQSLARVQEEFLKTSRYIAPHSSYYVREMRRKAYAQILESYKTLSMKSMAEAFGVTVQFIDQDLAKFIPQKKLNCVLDRVDGVIVTNRPDNKNAQYQQLIKQGDALLTKLQKYGAAVRLSGAERM